MKIAFYTLGCKVNTYDTEAVWETFRDKGFNRVSFDDFSDVYVINTCTVTNTAASKSRKKIRQAIRQNENAVVVVMGCYAQISSDEIEGIEGVDIIVGTNDRLFIVDKVIDFVNSRKPINIVDNILLEKSYEELSIDNLEDNTRAFLKIQEGCVNYCSYCIIPFARGRQRSRLKEDVLEEANRLVNNGYEEIVLTGINTATYGFEFDNYDFGDLLNDISKIKGLKRLRISSIEVTLINDKILNLIENNNILADHLHIPLQSGCDTVLERMNRKYDTLFYKNMIDKIRKVLANIAITTDVIVGFPGETEDEFKQTYDFIKNINFSELHIFPYSRRNGTKAAKMDNQILNIVKHTRVLELSKLNEISALEYASIFLNKELDVIYETKEDDYMIGHASNYLKVKTKYDENHFKKETKTLITKIGYPMNEGIIK